MTRIGLISAPLPLTACGPRAETAVPGESAEAAPIAPPTEARPGPEIDLAGEYRIAGVDGADIDQPHAITAAITADFLDFAWTHTVQSARIATTRAAVEGCARGPTAAEEAVVAAFDSAATVVRTAANGVELRGGGHSVTLFSQ